jgi:penicillin-binding protein 1A
MREARLISPVSAAAASRQSVHFATPDVGRRPTGLEYAVDYVLDRLPPLASVAKRTVVVETTIDPDVQRRAQSVVSDMLAKEGAAAKVGQGAMVVLDTSGGIRALVGGRSFAESQFDRAVKARRQPGSAFKPFVYIAALENGMWPDTPVEDAPIEIGNWSPRNDDGRYRGPITLTQALAHSVNTVAVRLQQRIGSGKVANVARRLGIKSDLRLDASMALGTSEVGLLELCGAYGTLAAGGLAVDPFVVQRIRTTDGSVLYERPEPSPRMVVAPDTIGAINTMLNAAIVSGTGRRAAFPRHQAAGKTGTTQDFRDAWFVGYTAHLVAGVWLGNDDGSPMNHVTGGSLPARMWRAVMEPAHAGLTPRSLPAIGTSVLDPTRAPEAVAHEPPALPAPAIASDATLSAATVQPVAAANVEIPKRPSRKPLSRNERATEAKARPVKAARQAHRPKSRHVAPVRKADRVPAHRMPTRPIDPEIFAKAMSDAKEPVAGTSPASPKPVAAPGSGIDAGRIRDALRELGEPPTGRMSLGVGRTGQKESQTVY